MKRIIKIFITWVSEMMACECPNCGKRKLYYSGDDWTGRVWISIYKCNNCKKEYV